MTTIDVMVSSQADGIGIEGGVGGREPRPAKDPSKGQGRHPGEQRHWEDELGWQTSDRYPPLHDRARGLPPGHGTRATEIARSGGHVP
jgi:hypothetical protein